MVSASSPHLQVARPGFEWLCKRLLSMVQLYQPGSEKSMDLLSPAMFCIRFAKFCTNVQYAHNIQLIFVLNNEYHCWNTETGKMACIFEKSIYNSGISENSKRLHKEGWLWPP
jgi:hypothetical protein